MKKGFRYLIPAFAAAIPLFWGHIADPGMAAVQAGTLAAAFLLFSRLSEGTDVGYSAFFGVLLYMTCPYRIYVCFELADRAQGVVWALMPLYIWALLGIVRRRGLIVSILSAALCLAAMGYAEPIQMLIAAGATLFAVLCLRKPLLLIPVGAGCILALPPMARLSGYLFTDAYAQLEIPVGSIMGRGYVPGEFFSFFVYREGHPGLGAGMLLCLLTGLWLVFARARQVRRGACVFFTALAGIFLLLSLQQFPWEFVQRLGQWAFRLVTLLETPAVFFGMAQICLCVSGAWAMGQPDKQEDRSVPDVVRVLALAFCLGGCICQCVMSA